MNAGIVLGWVGGWLITAAMAWLVSYVSDDRVSWWWAFAAILAFDVVRWILSTAYAQAIWSFFFKRHVLKDLKALMRNEGMPKFDNVKRAKDYYEWIYESSPLDRDKNGKPISINARVAAARLQSLLDGIISGGQMLAWLRMSSVHDQAVADYLNSPHVAAKKEMSMDEFLGALEKAELDADKPE